MAQVLALRNIRRHHKDPALVISHVEKMLSFLGRRAAKKFKDQ
jgi:hypothetical protein